MYQDVGRQVLDLEGKDVVQAWRVRLVLISHGLQVNGPCTKYLPCYGWRRAGKSIKRSYQLLGRQRRACERLGAQRVDVTDFAPSSFFVDRL